MHLAARTIEPVLIVAASASVRRCVGECSGAEVDVGRPQQGLAGASLA